MQESEFLKAITGQHHKRIPVWYMRQAGRHLSALRDRLNAPIFETVKRPEIASAVSLAPVAELGVDAAIIFADITTPLEAAGLKFDLRPGYGPYPEFSAEQAVEELERFDPFTMDYIGAQIRKVKERAPVIGFVGGPFTLLTYALGDTTRDKQRTKALLMLGKHRDLLSLISKRIAEYAEAQAEWGADAVQVFESWLGLLDRATYEGIFKEHLTEVLRRASAVPTILFCRWCSGLISYLPTQHISFFNPDWSVSLSSVERAMEGVGLQGNLDPAYALTDPRTLLQAADSVISQVSDRQRYIFNMGHGVYPETDTAMLKALTDHVKSIRIA